MTSSYTERNDHISSSIARGSCRRQIDQDHYVGGDRLRTQVSIYRKTRKDVHSRRARLRYVCEAIADAGNGQRGGEAVPLCPGFRRGGKQHRPSYYHYRYECDETC